MTTTEFEQYWRSHYRDTLPIGSHLRSDYQNRWFRIHTLPRSKRYQETESEYREILARHNALLSDLLGNGREYVLLTTGYPEKPIAVRDQELENLDSNAKALFSICKSALEGQLEPYYWHFFMSERSWKENSADDLLKLIADNVIANVLFVGLDLERVYHPYDGGADIIVESEYEMNLMKKKYADWLSKEASGL